MKVMKKFMDVNEGDNTLAAKKDMLDPTVQQIIEKHPELDAVIEKNPDIIQSLIIAAEYSGPIPHPSVLQQYNNIHDGFANRIIKMAEKDADHIREMQKAIFLAKKQEVTLGQVFAFLIGMSALICGTVAVIYDHPVTAGFIGTGGVIGLVSVFIFGRAKKQNSGKAKP